MKEEVKVKTQRVIVTPVQASNWLTKNTENRPLSEKLVYFYTNQIKKGKWKLTTDSIGFDYNGKLVNGQHRLSAVVRANKDAEFLVTYGLEPDAFNTIDTGKNRSAADILGVAGIKTPGLIASIVRFIIYYHTNSASVAVKGGIKMSNQDVLDFVKRHRISLDLAVSVTHQVIKEFSGIPSRFVGGLYYIFAGIDQDDAKEFFMFLATGISLTKEDAIYQLRKRLIENMSSVKKFNEKDKIALSILAWNHWRKGNKIQKLQWAGDGKQSFPKPV